MPTKFNFTPAEKERKRKEKKRHHFDQAFSGEEKKKIVRHPAVYSNTNWNDLYKDELNDSK